MKTLSQHGLSYIIYLHLLLVLVDKDADAAPVENGLKQDLNWQQQHQKRRISKRSGHDEGGNAIDIICPIDEYFDEHVHACSRCSDICRPNIDIIICLSKCREYYIQNLNSSVSTHPVAASSLDLDAHSSSEERLVDKPLFWTSVGSMMIAIAATITIIVLCLKRRKLSPVDPRRMLANEIGSNDYARSSTYIYNEIDPGHEGRILLVPNPMNRGNDPSMNRNDPRRGLDDRENHRHTCMTGGNGTERYYTGNCSINRPNSDLPSTPSPGTSPDRRLIPLQREFSYESAVGCERCAASSENYMQKPLNLIPDTDESLIIADGHDKATNPQLYCYKTSVDLKDDATLLGLHSPSLDSSYTSFFPPSTRITTTKYEEPTNMKRPWCRPTPEDNTRIKNSYQDDDVDLIEYDEDETYGREPKDMGISINKQNSIDDITRLKIMVRSSTAQKTDYH